MQVQGLPREITRGARTAATFGRRSEAVEAACLRDSRYTVAVSWWLNDEVGGNATVVRAGTNDSAVFSYFDKQNWELLLKVLDGCEGNGHHWVFVATASDLGHRITITDTASGQVKEYTKEPGSPAPAITDVTAFSESCSAPAADLP